MRFSIYQDSRCGRRPMNQDRVAYCYSRAALVMVLADGMGGHAGGEVAAEILARHVVRRFQLEARPELDDAALFLSRAFTGAHHAILDHAWAHRLPDPPSTTAVACVVQRGQAHWAHAGDSRAYLLRAGTVRLRTRDHSWVRKLVDQGAIGSEAAAHHPARNRIYSCLGGHQSPQIDGSPALTLENGDVVLLCSDGVWDPLGDDGIAQMLEGAAEFEAGMRALMDEAERRAGATADNLSAIAMRWNDPREAGRRATIFTRTMMPDRFVPDDFGGGAKAR